MKKFAFELEKVLEFRNFEKQQAEADLAKALNVEAEINNKLEIIAQQYVSLKQFMKGSLDFSDMMSMSQNQSLLNYQKEELLKQLAEAKLISEQKREILKECMKKTTALEKMKEMQFEQYKEEQKIIENKQTEELATIKSNSSSLQ